MKLVRILAAVILCFTVILAGTFSGLAKEEPDEPKARPAPIVDLAGM